MMTTPVDTLRQTAYAAIRKKIASGELSPGDRVSELSISKELGISRAPVREAISRFVSEGIVFQMPGAGAWVRLPSEEEVAELFDFRAAMESFAAWRAAGALEAAQLAKIRLACEEQEKLIDDALAAGATGLSADGLDAWSASNDELHQTILTAGGNTVITRHAADLRLFRALFTRYFSPRDATPGDDARPGVIGLLRQNLDEHRAILRALDARDADEARQAMTEHIFSAKRETLAQMRRDRADAGEASALHTLTRMRATR